MRFLVLVAFLVVAASADALLEADTARFEGFMKEHSRSYATDEEKLHRFAVFRANMRRAEELNREHNGEAEFGATKFSDLTPEEFRAKYLSSMSPASIEKHTQRLRTRNLTVDYVHDKNLFLATTVDWRVSKMMSPVANQGSCGCCWSFAALHEVESQMLKKGWGTYSLAEQQLVDCDTSNSGCEGGFYASAWEYVYNNGGVAQSYSYPYEDGQGSCRYAADSYTVQIDAGTSTQASGLTNIYSYIASHGPAAAALDATLLQNYKSGVMNPSKSSCPSVNHAVVIAGYVSNTSPPYFIVKNSWGSDWAAYGGYFYINVNSCGISSYVYGSHAFYSN